ncbi:hypothetical protein PISMIDRAFT_17062 [Pisolithus microcarpus 441]|uniref:Unplaced genomic scaffold scaffold_240, whole genome shotgun sequence n=1 Tax=Pisolithus microcarpus 441 TaxID=765257 RepID=A0A0C9YLJ3_9AGAM|nr:hypothetical protein PISMIDRAFT_17062 [Pisolithus microcarpus 441]
MWKFHVQKVLEIQGLWEVIGGTDQTAPSVTTHPDEHAEWSIKDREACAQVTLTLKDEPLNGVMYVMTVAESWRKLSKHYEGQGKQTIAYLIRELFHGTLVDDSPMEPQLNAMQQKSLILNLLGQSLNESLVAIAMVISLPQSYSTLHTILMSTNDKLTSHSALVLKKPNNGDNKKKKGKGKGKSKITCYGCKETGHTKDKCPQRKNEDGKSSGDLDKDKKEKMEKADLSVKVAQVAKDLDLCLFMACANLKVSSQ